MATTFFALPLKAQVTIGDLTVPQPFSLLELSTARKIGGLRLPQLSTAERDAITTGAFKANPLANGLVIFNTTTSCVNVWNGTAWIEWCGAPVPATYDDSQNYRIAGKICYDVWQTDWEINDECKPKSARIDDFANGYSFIYNFYNLADFSDLTFEFIDPDHLIDSYVQSGSGGSVLTVNFDPNIKTKAATTTRANAKKVSIIAIYKDNNSVAKQVALEISVQDCSCGCLIANPNGGFITFMCYNLGAADIVKTMNPTLQQLHNTPDDNYGDLYQWGRKADGHQLRDIQPPFPPGPLSGSNLDANNQPTGEYAGQFITNYQDGWITPQVKTIWNSGTEANPVKTVNDPCPVGWRVPTNAELSAIANSDFNTIVWQSGPSMGLLIRPKSFATDAPYTLFLPSAGYRWGLDGSLAGSGNGYYWSSTADELTTQLRALLFYKNPGVSLYGNSANAFSVRCVAE